VYGKIGCGEFYDNFSYLLNVTLFGIFIFSYYAVKRPFLFQCKRLGTDFCKIPLRGLCPSSVSKYTAAYLPHARIVEPQKQPF
jgi:hypothetical protein